MDCLFCKITGGEIPSKFVYEDESVVAFRDINPQAPQHILIDVVPKLVKDLKIAESGYRVVINTGDEGGQTVHHLHVHLIGGRSMQWPPG